MRSLPLSPLERVRWLAYGLLRQTMGPFAERLGVGREHLYKVLQGRRSSDPLRARIAAELGVDQADIWPPETESSASMRPGASEANPNQIEEVG